MDTNIIETNASAIDFKNIRNDVMIPLICLIVFCMVYYLVAQTLSTFDLAPKWIGRDGILASIFICFFTFFVAGGIVGACSS